MIPDVFREQINYLHQAWQGLEKELVKANKFELKKLNDIISSMWLQFRSNFKDLASLPFSIDLHPLESSFHKLCVNINNGKKLDEGVLEINKIFKLILGKTKKEVKGAADDKLPWQTLFYETIASKLIHSKKYNLACEAIFKCSKEKQLALLLQVPETHRTEAFCTMLEEQNLKGAEIFISSFPKGAKKDIFLMQLSTQYAHQDLVTEAREAARQLSTLEKQKKQFNYINNRIGLSHQLQFYSTWYEASMIALSSRQYGEALHKRIKDDPSIIFTDSRLFLLFAFLPWIKKDRTLEHIPEIFHPIAQNQFYALLQIQETLPSDPAILQNEINRLIDKLKLEINFDFLNKIFSEEPASPSERSCLNAINKIIDIVISQHQELLQKLQKILLDINDTLSMIREAQNQEREFNWDLLLFECELEEEAVQKALEIADDKNKLEALSTIVLISLDRGRYAEAITAAQAITIKENRLKLFEEILNAIPKEKNPEKALNFMLTMPPGEFRRLACETQFTHSVSTSKSEKPQETEKIQKFIQHIKKADDYVRKMQTLMKRMKSSSNYDITLSLVSDLKMAFQPLLDKVA